MTDKTSVTTFGISTRSKVALVTLISATVLGSVYYNKLRRGKKASEIDPKDKLIDDNSLYNDFVASLPDSFTLIDSSTDSFISKLFSSPISMPSIIPTSFEELKEQMSSLYPNFENQLETIRDMYKNFWDFLSLEEFKNIVNESMKEDDDPKLHPEIKEDARVREGQDLSEDEKRFIQLRKKKMRAAFAFFIGVDENEVEIEDIPNIGIASSGGGYRAMVGCSGYLHAMIETGILDCVLYMAGVSGSTWAMSQFYSPLSDGSSKLLKDHLCSRIHTHIANLSNFLTVLNASRHNSKIILHGIIQRYYQQQGTINLVDIFGMLLGGTLLARTLTIASTDDQPENDVTAGNVYSSLAEEEQAKQIDKTKTVEEDDGSIVKPKLLHRSEIKLSKQRAYFEDGSLPMPIYCAVRHEIGIPSTAKANTISQQENIEPCEEIKNPENWERPQNDTTDKEEDGTEDQDKVEGEGEDEDEDEDDEGKTAEENDEEENVEDDMKDLYQWFEFTPYDMGSEEINAWIPIWAFGRKFQEGINTEKLPEQSLGILMGMFGSAFVASLAHFYQEIRLILPSSAVEKADEMIKSYRSSVSTIHPISPASFPNPFYKMTPQVQTKNEDEDVEEILRTENLVESEQIGLMDAGMDNNIPFYPLLRKGRDVDIILSIDLSADIQDAPYFDRAEGYVKRRGIKGWPRGAGWPKPDHEKKDSVPTKVDYQQKKDKTSEGDDDKHKSKYALDTCTVFASSSSETTPADGKSTTTYPENVNPITLVYFPLIVNPNYDPEFDPQTAEFCSTWNFVYSTEQVNKLHGLAERNVKDNLEKVRNVFKETWKRKRDERLKREDLTNI